MITFLPLYNNIFNFTLCVFALLAIFLTFLYLLSKADLENLFTYECEFQPFSETSNPFEVQFINHMNGYIIRARFKTRLKISSNTKHTASVEFSIKNFPPCINMNRSTTVLIYKTSKNKIMYRTMMTNARVLNHAARAAYYVLQSLSNDELVESISKDNKMPLVNSLVRMSLDSSQGISQHKTKLVQAILSQKFHSEEVHESLLVYFNRYTAIDCCLVKNEPHTLVDSRFINELSTAKHFLERRHKDLSWFLLTNDARAANFPYQHQSNHDFWVGVNTKTNGVKDSGFKCVNHDDKSGLEMLSSASGTLGTLSYENGVLIPFTKKAINLAAHNVSNINTIRNVFDTRNNDTTMDELLTFYQARFNEFDKNPNDNLFILHEQYQDSLWDNIQTNSKYERSISFVFTEQVSYKPFNDKQERFVNHFKSLLGNKTYDLDRQGDRFEIFKAMWIAYQQNVDRDIMKKLSYLNKDMEIDFNERFLHQVAKLMKDGFS